MAWRLDNYEGTASKKLSFSGGANKFPFATAYPKILLYPIGKEILTDDGISEIYKAQNLHFLKVKHKHLPNPFWTLAQNGQIIRDDAHRCKVIAKPVWENQYTAFVHNDFDGGAVIAIVHQRQETEMENHLALIPALRVCGQLFSYRDPIFQKEELKDSDFDWTVGDGVKYL